jgi:hypothetical protein
MRKLFGNLLGGKGGIRQTAKDLLSELQGEGVSREIWQQCRDAEDLEDVFQDEIPREQLVGVVSKKPENVFDLVNLCVETIEETLPKEEIEDADAAALANAMVVLTHLLAAGPGGPIAEAPPSDSIPEGSSVPVEVQHPLLRLLWDHNIAADGKASTARPVAERIIDATMRTLFLDNFTIQGSDERQAGQSAPSKDIVDGVDVECLWYTNIGPVPPEEKGKEVGQAPPDDETRENRVVALQLLLTVLCGGAPSVVLKDLEVQAKAEAKNPRRGRGAPKEPKKPTEQIAAEGESSVFKPLISDLRFLSYLQDSERHVPFRGELLCSLLSLVLDYEPTGGLFSGNKEQDYVTVALQVLTLLLQDNADASVSTDVSVVARKPQELVGIDESPLPIESTQHVFRMGLQSILSDRAVEFVAGGVMALFEKVTEGGRSYLPGSSKPAPFLCELLVLVYHLSGCPKFVEGICNMDPEQGDPAQLTESIVQVSFQGPEHIQDDDLVSVAMATLMRLTAYRDVCDKLNEAYEDDTPDDLPDFSGSHADLIVLTALKRASDHINTAQVNSLHRSIVEASLCTLANVSTFAEGLCMESCFRLFSLLERCGKMVHVKKGRSGISICLPRILETFQNAVQYQYALNLDMVYGLMTRQALLKDLLATAVDITVVNGEGANGSAADGLHALPAEWWQEVKARLQPIVALLDRVAPALEAEVEKRDISSSEEAKKLLPRTALGLLPVPHPFELRSIRENVMLHRNCERCLVACVAHGPAGDLWEEDEADEEEEEEEEKPPKKKAERAGSGERKRERSTSRRRGSKGEADSASLSGYGASAGSRGGKRSGSRTRLLSGASVATSSSAPPPAPSPPTAAPAVVPEVAPAALSADTPEPEAITAPQGPADLQSQLQAAAASGVDINALLAALAAQQAAAAPAPTNAPEATG